MHRLPGLDLDIQRGLGNIHDTVREDIAALNPIHLSRTPSTSGQSINGKGNGAASLKSLKSKLSLPEITHTPVGLCCFLIGNACEH